jgi:sugar lactone lactonase YvrE
MGESPRWHEGLLWFSDWGAQEIIAVDSTGRSEVMLRVPFALPFLILVSGREGRFLRQEPNGKLVMHADMHGIGDGVWKEIVVDGRGNIYINSGSGIVLVKPDGTVRLVARDFAFPNGMARCTEQTVCARARRRRGAANGRH